MLRAVESLSRRRAFQLVIQSWVVSSESIDVQQHYMDLAGIQIFMIYIHIHIYAMHSPLHTFTYMI